MSEQRTGKATAELFEQVILRRLGAKDDDVLIGPRHGVDVGVVRVADGVAMALTADPVFIVPAYGWERAAWFAVHILASDAALKSVATISISPLSARSRIRWPGISLCSA